MSSTETTLTDSGCDFCKIAQGAEEAIIVCESRECVAFFPHNPAVLGHTLVIPRRHVPHLWLVEAPLDCALMAMVVRVGRALEAAIRPAGLNLITSAGQAASQTVFHLHLHVVPRWEGDRIGHIWPPPRPTSEAVKEDIAELVRAHCADRL